MSDHPRVRTAAAHALVAAAMLALVTASCGPSGPQGANPEIPRTASGRPNLQGIWQVRNSAAADLLDHAARHEMRAGRSVVEGNEIPYQPWAAAKKIENAANRAAADPLSKCYMPGVPRIMYMPHPFHLFQTDDHVGITFEWSQVFRLIYTNGSKPHDGIEFWMGDSRGRWEGDTLVVDVTNHNDQTWFDMAGNFHSEALHLVERFTMTGPDAIQYEVTVEDPKVFTRPWKISMPLYRQTNTDRVLEYHCNAEAEEARGDFERDPRTWYPGPTGQAAPAAAPADEGAASGQAAAVRPATGQTANGSIRRLADGKPDLSGHFLPDGGGANYGLETHPQDFLTPGGRGVIVDPPDGQLPMLPWAEAEQKNRMLPERGYDDPTAHCFRRRRAAVDVHPVAPAHPPAAWLRGDAPRAHVVARHPARRPAAHPRQHPLVARRFGRTLGGRHAGHRDAEPERQDLAERGRRDREPRGNGGRAVDAGGCATRSTTRRRSPTRWSTRGRGRSRCR